MRIFFLYIAVKKKRLDEIISPEIFILFLVNSDLSLLERKLLRGYHLPGWMLLL